MLFWNFSAASFACMDFVEANQRKFTGNTSIELDAAEGVR
jgi:hypothetical protein